VLINRTAVYKMCKAMPGELRRRGFQVSCSALLARLDPDRAEPITRLDHRLFQLSQRWLRWALTRPGFFHKTSRLTGVAPSWLHRHGTSIFLDPLFVLFYGAPQTGIVLVYDITTVTDAGWHQPAVSRLYAHVFDLLARSRCHLVSSCQCTADELRVNWGIAPSRITVLPLGLFSLPSPLRGPGSTNQAPFLLFVGNLEPRKNVPGLIRAYSASGLFDSQGMRLRIIGSLPADDHPVLTLARGTPGVDVLGFVSDEELAASYEQCRAFVYPSFCEGFGLPLLEAMHRGCVCLSTTIGASPEIAGDAALYVNPHAPAEIVEGLRRVASLTPAQRKCLAERARERAQTFNWRRFYDGLAKVVRQTAAA
jgi:glycosyltransferase involved in cell wall biosynthesis